MAIGHPVSNAFTWLQNVGAKFARHAALHAKYVMKRMQPMNSIVVVGCWLLVVVSCTCNIRLCPINDQVYTLCPDSAARDHKN